MNEQTRKALELARQALSWSEPGSGDRCRAIAAIDAALSAPVPVEPGYLSRLIDRLLMPMQAVTERELRDLHNECAAMLHLLAKQPAATHSAPAAPVAQPLTDEQIGDVARSCYLDITDSTEESVQAFGVAVMVACAEAWGVKLDGIGQGGAA